MESETDGAVGTAKETGLEPQAQQRLLHTGRHGDGKRLAEKVRRSREMGALLAGSGGTFGDRKEYSDSRHFPCAGGRGGETSRRMGQRRTSGQRRDEELQVGRRGSRTSGDRARAVHGKKVLHGDPSSRSTSEIPGRHGQQDGVDLKDEGKRRNQKASGAGYAAQRRQLQIQAARAACAAKAAGRGEVAEVHASQPCSTEFALVDVADAFTLLPVAPAEWKHTMTPGLRDDQVLIFQALLFGYKVAPLLYSRFASFLARLLQAAMEDSEAAHEVYLDDSLWCLRGSLRRRSLMLAFILVTMKALGVPVAIGKGARAVKVTWIGVTFEVEDQDTMIMGIPTNFATEMKDLLASWEGRGYAPLKELRVAAGKAAWLGGVLPRARWLTTVFYAVLTDTLREEEKEKEKGTASGSLFPVKRLELARQWAIKFLEAAMQRPLRRIQLREVEGADVRLMTDASPEGLGGILSIKGMRHFASYLKGKKVKFTVQADSIAALALTQKLAARAASPAMNFIGAELGITLEEMAVQEVIPLHIPGKANIEPDYLSRPSKWKEERMPAGLHGLEIDPVSGRSAEFYRLPSPMVEPSLWGVKGSAAGISAVWEAMQ